MQDLFDDFKSGAEQHVLFRQQGQNWFNFIIDGFGNILRMFIHFTLYSVPRHILLIEKQYTVALILKQNK